MKIVKIFLQVILIIFICLPVAWCIENSKEELSFQDCIGLALNNNVEVFLSHIRTSRARGEKLSFHGQLLPQIGLKAFQRRVLGENYGAGTVDIIEDYNFFDARVMVSQRIFDLTALAEAEAVNIKLKKACYQQLELVEYRAKMELKRIIKLPLSKDIVLNNTLGQYDQACLNLYGALGNAKGFSLNNKG